MSRSRNVANSTIFTQSGTGAVTRTVQEKLREWISVTDFGVVADGVTDNTAAYNAMIAALPAGSTIYWPKGTYVGDFISRKPFILRGNGSTLIGAGNFAVIEFQGTLGSYQNLSAAPTYGNTSLSGITDLTGDSMLLLYSGNTRPSDSSPVNYEVLKVKSTGAVYDKVYSTQNGGTPRYAVITPVVGVEIADFNFTMGTSASLGVFVRYAEDARVSNISMTGGSGTTVSVRSAINVTIDHIRRIKPSATGSGQGYNVELNITKYVKVDRVYGEETRHDFDQESSYVTDVSGVISVNCVGSAVILAHNGFGGFTSVRDCAISTNDYAIVISSQGASSPTSLMFRQLVIDNISISNSKNMAANDYYVGVYLQYPTENVSIENITIKNTNNPSSFDYKGGGYNASYYVIRAYRPDGTFEAENVVADSATAVIWVDNVGPSEILGSGVSVRNIKIDYFQDVVAVYNVLASGVGDVSVEDVKFYESSTVNGRAIISILSTSNKLRKLMVRGLYKIPAYGSTIYLDPGAGAPIYSHVDIAGFTRTLSTLNYLPAGGTITQNDFLTRGEFAIWGSTTKTLSSTVPIERPITTGNIFAIFNYGTGTLTIPGGSNTVDNASAINIVPNKTYYFIANSAGTKWTLMKVVTGDSLS